MTDKKAPKVDAPKMDALDCLGVAKYFRILQILDSNQAKHAQKKEQKQ